MGGWQGEQVTWTEEAEMRLFSFVDAASMGGDESFDVWSSSASCLGVEKRGVESSWVAREERGP